MMTLIPGGAKPLHLLCLGAHCDDIEIGAGGTLLKLIDTGCIASVTWVVLSSDAIRKKEAEQSAEIMLDKLHTKQVHIAAFRDGFLPAEAAGVKEFFESIKKDATPDLILTHYRDDRHQDHRLVSDLTWNTWRNHLIWEYEIPKYDGDLGQPNLYVPLEESYIERKNMAILRSFASQAGKHWFDDATFKALPRIRGIESATRYAEAFYTRKIVFGFPGNIPRLTTGV